MNADLAVQVAIRQRLVSSVAVTDLVPESNILDSNHRPAPRPGIILGETQITDEGEGLERKRIRVFHTLHILTVEPSTEVNKSIAGAVREAIRSSRLDLEEGLHAADARVNSSRTFRDPDRETAHGVLVVDVLVQELA